MNYESFEEHLLKGISEKLGSNEFVKVMSGRLYFVLNSQQIAPYYDVEYSFHIYQQVKRLDVLIDECITAYQNAIQAKAILEQMCAEKNTENIIPLLLPMPDDKTDLQNIAYMPYCSDMIIAFGMKIEQDDLILFLTKSNFKSFGLSEEELKGIAVQNKIFREDIDIFLIEEILPDEVTVEPYQFMPVFVASNAHKWYGASSILSTQLLESLADNLQEDIYIIPSSIHECILVPVSVELTPMETRSMLREINQTFVAKHDRLSNEIYLFDWHKSELYQVEI